MFLDIRWCSAKETCFGGRVFVISSTVLLILTQRKVLSCVIVLCLAWHDVFSLNATSVTVSGQFNLMTMIEVCGSAVSDFLAI